MDDSPLNANYSAPPVRDANWYPVMRVSGIRSSPFDWVSGWDQNPYRIRKNDDEVLVSGVYFSVKVPWHDYVRPVRLPVFIRVSPV